jgi:hypothetical protein
MTMEWLSQGARLKSFDWKARGARPHPIGRLDADKLELVRSIVGQILGSLPQPLG